MNPRHPEPHLALIVEDDHDVRDLAAALLEETPLDVVEV
jgi:CheY-like chemotaxis protein